MSSNIEGSRQMRDRTKHQVNDIDEWLRIESAAKINEVQRVSMTIFEERTKKTRQQKVDIQGMSKEDLLSLKTTDPFLYYSIPGVRAASVTLNDVDFSDVNALCQELPRQIPLALDRQRGNNHYQPPAATNTKVGRRSCLSFECHTSTLLDDALDEIYGNGAGDE
mmetsp:Transcript_700/g.1184  ORF Transcript_700/g.1184 Transcript_700/m.1184 type:complete len:165 (+) Transcript_700:57-551(+)|eukprot:CAMPEP_0201679186 /NCGR_PEP_ID=MMETSP0494-20130426/47873_1 /ASSEMBLY_ACC=CAM_ASM_000839 /TAXON_ID=420259 /ORGANISM="Thalassiosira gravida, Strain GMp14c1" /LENGTH=164 /DNA_ID=CAMNT_0048162587 /DNA_START=49 /DNA_END=543 /DNA_ORIENTATION=+